ncbi:hypothetical protein C6503_06080 [Candidatus Poribacteria bacterium]|nr:MAG: hypothetical protein C6503_06080 [Candidatus Poribacteria bacterium]
MLCFLFGIVMILTEFSPHTASQATYKEIANWGRVISPFVFVLAVVTLIQTHWTRIQRRVEHWQYSLVVFFGMIVMVVAGLPYGPQHPAFKWLFNNVQVPMDATMFSLLAFFIASAAYRAFRARTFEATLLLLTAVIVMVGNIPVGDLLWPDAASNARQWILDNPNLSARRGIILGVSLGAISQSIRIILGIERSYLG